MASLRLLEGQLPFDGWEEPTASLARSRRFKRSGTFVDNMALPVHRWFRYSAGFSAEWAKSLITQHSPAVVLDPFVGSGTVSVVSDELGIPSYGVEAHPFVRELAKAKLNWWADPQKFLKGIDDVLSRARSSRSVDFGVVPPLLQKCYTPEALQQLARIRESYMKVSSELSPEIASLIFLAITAMLRASSHVGTAQWQYILPNKRKAKVMEPLAALEAQAMLMASDMKALQSTRKQTKAHILDGDARLLEGIEPGSIDLVITSPPYPNNYDYADATRLEMTFWGEVDRWSDLHEKVRRFLIRSSSQHASIDSLQLDELLENSHVSPIRAELSQVCEKLACIRETKGGKKAYHTMVAAYFVDLARTFRALRRVGRPGCLACFVVGDSAPYGIHVPAERWLGELAISAGFSSWKFEKLRDRNTKWKNRKHRVPLHEGRLWLHG
ncbi:MAG: DNA modification methylase [Nitrosomonadales bacterium]|nr:DNA modification methylase [Nitrosomonadales bacterium]